MTSHFKNITFRQVATLIRVLGEVSLRSQEIVRDRFERTAVSYEETVILFCQLGLMAVEDNSIVVTRSFNKLLTALQESQDRERHIKAFIVQQLLEGQSPPCREVHRLMSFFQEKDGKYTFSPDNRSNIELSDIRNFLIELELLNSEPYSREYCIADEYCRFFYELRRTQVLTPQELTKLLANKSEVGENAEKAVLDYERERLSHLPSYVSRIRQVSCDNVNAGYDIESFEEESASRGVDVPRYIEVKAVSVPNWRFYWSRNEIETAKTLSETYYLYLLPVDNKQRFNINELMIIRNPYTNVYENKEKWLQQFEQMSFSLSKGAILKNRSDS